MLSLISLATLIEPQDPNPTDSSPRPIQPTDLPEIADLYQRAYGDGTSGPKNEDASRISAVYGGSQGAVLTQASLLTADAEGCITAAIITTERAFSDESRTAFIAELFTHPDYRRQGLAEKLLTHAMHALHKTGHTTLAVTVSSSNAAAMALYLSRDFRRFTPAANAD
jgi:ribosomal protein S18 acetylase RimI-like enzyme